MSLDRTMALGPVGGDEPPQGPQLIVLQGEPRIRAVSLACEMLRIGRQADNDLVLGSERISRRHLRVHCLDGRYFVEDLGSFNGTMVNGRKLEAGIRERLHHQDVLELSEYRLLFLDGEENKIDFGTIQLDSERVREEAAQALRDFLGR